ncbi:polysaccharide biosynthesis tyrosine autokinase [Bacillus sp. SG-1]|uniref:polysaccharide biosynthesis tyrosine autokinase n=1 Tax=Bacillus sp. SG-1 TaxID=161544 RepID=UPI00015432A8|nr:polysaccharide biosynthesis tyrosine autokinase [Bacillus sp. SG-1]EDL65253.1 cell surface polysaccharide biosynthesis / Chain length determinant protein [Bacillus sp. SG-1]
MNQSLTLKELFQILQNHFWLILSIIFLVTASGIILSLSLPKEYEAKVDLLVNYSPENNQGSLSVGEVETNLRLISTYKYILKSPRVLEIVAERTEENDNVQCLNEQISVTSSSDSQIISITATALNPNQAVDIVNNTAETFKEETYNLMQIDNIQILSYAQEQDSTTPVKPSLILSAGISFTIGIFLAILIVFIREAFFTKLNNQEKVERMLNAPYLGSVPKLPPQSNLNNKHSPNNTYSKFLISSSEANSPAMELYREIRTNIQFLLKKEKTKVLLVTSSGASEGKSLTTGNLAISMAMDGVKTVVIDMDLRKGVGSQLFHLPSKKGISNYLHGITPLNEIIQRTDIPKLFFISAGPLPPNPTELLSSDRLSSMINTLKKEVDLILIDTPPLIVSDAAVLSSRVDGCLFLINARKTRMETAKKNLNKLNRVGANIIGVILNKTKKEKSQTYYY